MGRFPQSDVDSLLAQCHRRMLHLPSLLRPKMETDHIVP